MSFRRLRKCIATVALSGTLPDKLEAAAAVGFDGVEIMEADLLSFDGSPADVRRICADLGLAIDLYQPFRDFEAMPEPQRARNMDRAERKFDVMQALGTDLTLVCSNTQAATIDDDARAAADLREMAERAARRGLRIGYEGLSWARHVRLWGHAWRIVQMADHPASARADSRAARPHPSLFLCPGRRCGRRGLASGGESSRRWSGAGDLCRRDRSPGRPSCPPPTSHLGDHPRDGGAAGGTERDRVLAQCGERAAARIPRSSRGDCRLGAAPAETGSGSRALWSRRTC